MKQNLTILGTEIKEAKKNGRRYLRVKTDYGWLSVFESDVAKDLMNPEHQGTPISVEVAERGDFKNITKFYGKVAGSGRGQGNEIKDSDDIFRKPEEIVPEEFFEEPKKSENKFITMYVSYAKDIFCAIYEKEKPSIEQMDTAIKAVQQAIESFS